MGFGIGSALKRGTKSIGRRLKEKPLPVVSAVQGIVVPDPPKLPEQIAAPLPDDELRRKTKERASQRKYAKAGRAGTMLTSDGGTLG